MKTLHMIGCLTWPQLKHGLIKPELVFPTAVDNSMVTVVTKAVRIRAHGARDTKHGKNMGRYDWLFHMAPASIVHYSDVTRAKVTCICSTEFFRWKDYKSLCVEVF